MTRSSAPPSDAPIVMADLWGELASGADEVASVSDRVYLGRGVNFSQYKQLHQNSITKNRHCKDRNMVSYNSQTGNT